MFDTRGFVLLWRKMWDNPICKKPHVFTESEAWIYIFSNLAQGVDRNGLNRGEFEASRGFLARKWMWSDSRVLRFLRRLERENMIQKPNSGANSQPNNHPNKFIVCNYDTYQNPRTGNRTANRTAERTQSKEGIKESIKEISPIVPKTGDETSFDKFWEAYPRKENKATAVKAWSRIGVDGFLLLEDIIPWLDKAKQSIQWQDKGMIPHASTFLNQRRWEGEPPPRDKGRSIHEELFGHPYPDEEPS